MWPEMLSDLIAARFVRRVVRRDLDSAAVRVEHEAVRRLLVIEAHYMIAAFIHPVRMCAVAVPLSGMLSSLPGVAAG